MNPTSTPPASSGSTSDDGFFTEEQLADAANFNFEERTLTIPELGGRKVGLRGLTVGDHESLTRQLPDNPEKWQQLHTALSLSKYVDRPNMSQERWKEIIAPWPASALARINREIFDIINVSDKEAAAAGVAFPAGDDRAQE